VVAQLAGHEYAQLVAVGRRACAADEDQLGKDPHQMEDMALLHFQTSEL
jgi:hypothetical protein